MRYERFARAAAVASVLLSAGCSLTDLDGLTSKPAVPELGDGGGGSGSGGDEDGSGGDGGGATSMMTGGGGAGTMPICAPGSDDCDGDGSCDDLMYDVARCGACDVACPGAGVTAVCDQGACVVSDLVPWAISVVLDGDEAFVGGTGVQHVDLTTAETDSVEGLSERCDSIVWDLHVDDTDIYAACNTEGMYRGARDGSSASALHNGVSQAVAGTNLRVYFGMNASAAVPGGADVPGTIVRYEKSSGVPGVQAPIVSDAVSPARIVVDPNYLYFTDAVAGTVRRIALGNTQEQDLISGQEPGAFDLAVPGSGDEIFWTAESRVRRMATGDIGAGTAAPATVIDEPPAIISGTSWPSAVYAIAVDSDWLYYTVSTAIGSAAPPWGALKRYPRQCAAGCDSQAETLMVDDTSRFGHIALDAEFVYWTAFEGGKLYRRAKN